MLCCLWILSVLLYNLRPSNLWFEFKVWLYVPSYLLIVVYIHVCTIQVEQQHNIKVHHAYIYM